MSNDETPQTPQATDAPAQMTARKRSAQPAPEPHQCPCSPDCTSTTKRTFAQGHDARLVADQVRQILAGDQSLESAASLIRERGGSESLIGKVYASVVAAQETESAKSLAAQARVAQRDARLAQTVLEHAQTMSAKGHAGWAKVAENGNADEIADQLRRDGVTTKRGAVARYTQFAGALLAASRNMETPVELGEQGAAGAATVLADEETPEDPQ